MVQIMGLHTKSRLNLHIYANLTRLILRDGKEMWSKYPEYKRVTRLTARDVLIDGKGFSVSGVNDNRVLLRRNARVYGMTLQDADLLVLSYGVLPNGNA